VRGLADLAAALEAAAGGDVLLSLRRDDERLLSAARLAEPASARWGGELAKPWLGVRTQVLTEELARLLATPDLSGFRISEVHPWTEAERSGLRVGDVIVELDGEAVEARRAQDAENLEREIETRAIGDRIELGVVRDGRRVELSVPLEARPRAAEEARVARQRELEFAVREIGFLDRVENHWQRDQSGVLVTEVTPGGWAQMGGLAAGDLVLSVAGRAIADVAAFESEMSAVLAARPDVIPVFVRRRWRTHFVFLEPEWPGPDSVPGGFR
ncbi:MAG: PDZ domain-containing protein, partial [Thermoanaerobaculia bacterium]